MIIHGTIIFTRKHDGHQMSGMIAGPKYIAGSLDGMASYVYKTNILVKILILLRYWKLVTYYHRCFIHKDLINDYKQELIKFDLAASFKKQNHEWYLSKILLTNSQMTMIKLAT